MQPIKSSEISNYLFCPTSWWLTIKKGIKITKAIKKGEKYHKTVSENQPRAKFLYAAIIFIIIIIVFLLLFGFYDELY